MRTFNQRWVTAFAAAALSGCLGGGGDDNKDSGGMRAADLSSVEGVAAQAGTIVETAAALSSVQALGGSTGPSPASTTRRPRATEACNSGTRSTQTGTKDVDTPFTEGPQPFNYNRVEWSNCTTTETFDDGQGTTDTTSFTLHGVVEDGENVIENQPPLVFYAQAGADRSHPLMLDAAFDQSSPDGSFSGDFSYDLFAHVDGTDDNGELNRTELQYQLDVSGNFSFTYDPSDGPAQSYNSNFSAFVGSASEPFKFTLDTADSNSQSFDGEYGFAIDPAPQGAPCKSGHARVATPERLVPDTSGTGSPYSDGTLVFTSDGKTATIEFLPDGYVRITDSNGNSQIVPYSQIESNSGNCAGQAFGGFVYAS